MGETPANARSVEGTAYSVSGETATIRLNPRVYNLEMAYSTAYPFLDKAWILFDGDPAREIIIKATRKDPRMDMELFARDFLNELVSITNYFNQFAANKDIINTILQRALFSASPGTAREAEQQEVDAILKDVDSAHPPISTANPSEANALLKQSPSTQPPRPPTSEDHSDAAR